jgi:protoporphyrinogen oxidase
MKLSILGGGLAGTALAYFLQESPSIDAINIFEKEDRLGGLCRSFSVNGLFYDIGPHIIFSKNKPILNFMLDLLGENQQQLRRSNRIIHKNCLVQYPFENDLGKLPAEDRDYCVNTFLHNPYENQQAHSMLQFFRKTFGEGITNLYLQPYNTKIWKFDPNLMDTQIVERIPKPPKEDILQSAQGKTIDGYLHQLHFSYPLNNGIESLIHGLQNRFSAKIKVHLDNDVEKLEKTASGFMVTTKQQESISDQVISTIPVDLLCKKYLGCSNALRSLANALHYNSILIAIINVQPDNAGDNFAFMSADPEIIFHRLSKLDFLGAAYHLKNSTTYMLEITFRKGDAVDSLNDVELQQTIATGLLKVGFINDVSDINFLQIKKFTYAYVIYDLNHRQNMNAIGQYFANEGIYLNGRFGEFEYLNMDAVLQHAKDLAEKILKENNYG